MTLKKMRLGAMPAGLRIEQEAVQVKDDGTESPRQAWNSIRASGAICGTRRAHSGGSSR